MRGLPMALRHNWKSHSEMRAARSIRFNTAILLFTLWCAPLIAYAEASLKSIEFSALPGDRVQISLGLSAP
ncbi:MAG: hypothetical protein AB2765_20485, partial [Candidatus Thiodiazotropha endolucinida]